MSAPLIAVITDDTVLAERHGGEESRFFLFGNGVKRWESWVDDLALPCVCRRSVVRQPNIVLVALWALTRLFWTFLSICGAAAAQSRLFILLHRHTRWNVHSISSEDNTEEKTGAPARRPCSGGRSCWMFRGCADVGSLQLRSRTS